MGSTAAGVGSSKGVVGHRPARWTCVAALCSTEQPCPLLSVPVYSLRLLIPRCLCCMCTCGMASRLCRMRQPPPYSSPHSCHACFKRFPLAQVHVCDGIKFVQDAPAGHYDVIVVDSSDPVGPAEVLFQKVRPTSSCCSRKGLGSARWASPGFYFGC